ncbi:hypothetical protein Tco_0501036 [Tanacetum coccineum]
MSEDEHKFPAKEQSLPTAESPGYVTESDPEEDPKEYEDDETEDGPVDYPMTAIHLGMTLMVRMRMMRTRRRST